MVWMVAAQSNQGRRRQQRIADCARPEYQQAWLHQAA
jgi:hypothetical protein